MEFLGYTGAFLLGLSLGLIGSGGSILTIPILVYLFGIDTLLATTYSLFVVGLTSLVGAIARTGTGYVHWPTTLTFGIPSVVSVFLTRTYLLPLIPDPVVEAEGLMIRRSVFLLLLFAALMLIAAFAMIRGQSEHSSDDLPPTQGTKNPLALFLNGLLAGSITGILGAGGGFLIIPVLVLMAKLSMQQAVGTSLIIIATNSLTGFWRDYKWHSSVDWRFLLHFSTIAIVGILAGSILSRHISGDKLKPVFGYFILVMGFYIIIRELFLS